LLALFFWTLHGIFTADQTGRQVSLDELTALAANHRVATATLRDVDNRVVGTYVAGPGVTDQLPNLPSTSPINSPLSSGRFYADYPQSAPLTADLFRALTAGGAKVTVDHQVGKQREKLISEFLLPLLILATV